MKKGNKRARRKQDLNEINEFIKIKILEHADYDFQDEELLEVYKGDFQSFTSKTFRNCNQIHVRKLCALLWTNNVWGKGKACQSLNHFLARAKRRMQSNGIRSRGAFVIRRKVQRRTSLLLDSCDFANDTGAPIPTHPKTRSTPSMKPNPMSADFKPTIPGFTRGRSQTLGARGFGKEFTNLVKMYRRKQVQWGKR